MLKFTDPSTVSYLEMKFENIFWPFKSPEERLHHQTGNLDKIRFMLLLLLLWLLLLLLLLMMSMSRLIVFPIFPNFFSIFIETWNKICAEEDPYFANAKKCIPQFLFWPWLTSETLFTFRGESYKTQTEKWLFWWLKKYWNVLQL